MPALGTLLGKAKLETMVWHMDIKCPERSELQAALDILLAKEAAEEGEDSFGVDHAFKDKVAGWSLEDLECFEGALIPGTPKAKFVEAKLIKCRMALNKEAEAVPMAVEPEVAAVVDTDPEVHIKELGAKMSKVGTKIAQSKRKRDKAQGEKDRLLALLAEQQEELDKAGTEIKDYEMQHAEISRQHTEATQKRVGLKVEGDNRSGKEDAAKGDGGSSTQQTSKEQAFDASCKALFRAAGQRRRSAEDGDGKSEEQRLKDEEMEEQVKAMQAKVKQCQQELDDTFNKMAKMHETVVPGNGTNRDGVEATDGQRS